MNSIQAQQLTKRFDKLTAVDGLSLAIQPGEIFGLVGPDGAGKTTTIRMLTSLMDPSGGSAAVMGYDTVRQAEQIKEQIGYMSQRFGLYADLTVMENLHFYADIYGLSAAEKTRKIEELLTFSNLKPFKERLAGNLSGGMKQKLGLSCALIHTPKVLFLDEPTNGVDPVSRRDFWRILYQLLQQKVTIFMSTAYLDEAERCSRIGLINNGKLLAMGTLPEIKKLMPKKVVSIRTVQARKTFMLLREKYPEVNPELFGSRVHVYAKDTAAAEKRVREILTAAHIPLDEVNVLEPSLEDVFISFLTEQEQQHG